MLLVTGFSHPTDADRFVKTEIRYLKYDPLEAWALSPAGVLFNFDGILNPGELAALAGRYPGVTFRSIYSIAAGALDPHPDATQQQRTYHRWLPLSEGMKLEGGHVLTEELYSSY